MKRLEDCASYADMVAAKAAYLADTADAAKRADYQAKARACIREIGWPSKVR